MNFDDFVMEGACMQVVVIGSNTVILLPLRPVSLMYKNPQRCKTILFIIQITVTVWLHTVLKGPSINFQFRTPFFLNWDSLVMDIGAHDFSQDESQDTI